jgi:hypothetical protein
VAVAVSFSHHCQNSDDYQFRFIIDGVITLPIAFYGFLVFPDVPSSTTKVFYLSEEVCFFEYQQQLPSSYFSIGTGSLPRSS